MERASRKPELQRKARRDHEAQGPSRAPSGPAVTQDIRATSKTLKQPLDTLQTISVALDALGDDHRTIESAR